MIRISTDGAAVILDITLARTGDAFQFQFNTHSAAWARLLAAAINDTQARALQRIREQAYDEGYRDGRAKRARRTSHGGWW